jgi:uncharacterized protein
MAMPSTTLSTLEEDELDDLIYYSRIGDLPSLKSTLTSISSSHSVSATEILLTAIDSDTSNPSSPRSGCSLLHYPSANGAPEILSHLISLLQRPSDTTSQPSSHRLPASTTEKPTSNPGLDLINHKNNSGNTALHWAALNGHLECVKILVHAGADPTITNEAEHDAFYDADGSASEGGRLVAEWFLRECEGLERRAGVGEAIEVQEGTEQRGGDEIRNGVVSDAAADRKMEIDGEKIGT